MADATESTTSSLNIYVAGADTFVGLEAVRYLAKAGHNITAQTVGSDGATAVRAAGGIPVYDDPYRAGEIASSLHMAGADVVVNCAPQAANQGPFYRLQLDERRLVEGTAALLEAVKMAGSPLLIHLSYAFLYGNYAGEWVDEGVDSCFPDEAEALLKPALTAEKQVLASDGPTCVLRAGYVYGTGSDALAALQDKIGTGLPLGSKTAYSNWVHVNDLLQAVTLVAEQRATGLFNIADDNPATPHQFADTFAEMLGLHSANEAPPFLARTSKLQAFLLKNAVRAKNDKAKEQLGWQPQYPAQRAGIEQVLLYWRAAQPTT